MRVKEGRRRGEDREGRGGGRREKEGREAFKMLDIISVNFFFSITIGSIFSHLEAMFDDSITFLDHLASTLGTPYSVLVMNRANDERNYSSLPRGKDVGTRNQKMRSVILCRIT